MSNKLLSKEKVTESLRNHFGWTITHLNEVVETVFNPDNEFPNPFLQMKNSDHKRITRKRE